MPSGYSASKRFELQATGENVNTWGVRLDTALERIDFSIAGVATIALSGAPYTLTASNTADDEARAAILIFTGIGGGTVTVPSVTQAYRAHNKNSGPVILTAGAGSVTIDPGDVVTVYCDGTDVKPGIGFADSGGDLLSLKDYISAQALAAGTGAPGVTGNAGKVLYTNGFTMSWQQLTTANLSDYATDQTNRDASSLGLAVAMAVAL